MGYIAEARTNKGNIQASSICHLLDVWRTAVRYTALSEETASGKLFHGFFCKQLVNMAAPSS
jgi:hypothetical protein